VTGPELAQGSMLNPYDLAKGFFCEECGRNKMDRLLSHLYTPLRTASLRGAPHRLASPAPPALTGCKTCDDVILAHRCTTRPDIGTLADGERWECPQCGSAWTARVEQVVTEEREWDCTPAPEAKEPPVITAEGS
jgi:predicted RNA-binding Zn-ribbon protein involved in translation (DUF1610 family)